MSEFVNPVAGKNCNLNILKKTLIQFIYRPTKKWDSGISGILDPEEHFESYNNVFI